LERAQAQTSVGRLRQGHLASVMFPPMADIAAAPSRPAGIRRG
jgi:hypothetical protein